MMYNLTHLLYKSCSRKSSYSKIASKLATMCLLLVVVVVVAATVVAATVCGMFCFAVFRAAFDLCVDFVHIYLRGAAYGKSYEICARAAHKLSMMGEGCGEGVCWAGQGRAVPRCGQKRKL